MHALDDPGFGKLDTAEKVFDKYFQRAQWSGPNNVPFYGMGPGGNYAKTALTFSTQYMSETTGSAGQPLTSMIGWDYTPGARYLAMLTAAASQRRSIIVNFNGTRYMEAQDDRPNCPTTSLWCIFNQNQNVQTSELQRDQYGALFSGEKAGGQCEVGYCFLTLARGVNLNDDQGTLHRRYKKRNLQQALGYLLNWAEANPGLLVAVTMDSETSMGAKEVAVNSPAFPRFGDYSVPMLLQYRAFQKWRFGNNLVAYNSNFQSCQAPIPSLEAVMPPTNTGKIDRSNPASLSVCWKEWQDFRVLVVNQMVDDTARWAADAGVPPSRIYSHQSVNNTYTTYLYEASPVWTAHTTLGHAGVDLYPEQLFPNQNGVINWDVSIMNNAQNLDGAWGIPEFSAGLGPTVWGGQISQRDANGTLQFRKCLPADDADIYNRTLNTLVNSYQRGNRLIMPYLWNLTDSGPLLAYGIGNCWPAIRAYRAFIDAW